MKKSLFLLISLAGVLIFSTAMATTIDTTTNFASSSSDATSLGPLDSNSYRWDVGQTFTLQTGDDTNLDSITFYLANSSDDTQQVTVSLYQGSSYITGDTIQLGDTTTNGTTSYDDYVGCMIDYASSGTDINLTVGLEYLWVLEGTSGTDVLVGAVKNNPYANGAAYVRSAGTTSWQNWHTEKDVAFIMELSGDSGGQDAVPEPATMLLFGIGLLGVAGIGRKQKA